MLYADNSCRLSETELWVQRSEVVRAALQVPMKKRSVNVILGVRSRLLEIDKSDPFSSDLQWKSSEPFTDVSSALKIKR